MLENLKKGDVLVYPSGAQKKVLGILDGDLYFLSEPSSWGKDWANKSCGSPYTLYALNKEKFIKQEEKKSWPSLGDLYWFLDSEEGDIYSDSWEDHDKDNWKKASGNCFKTALDAQCHKAKLIQEAEGKE